MGDVANILKDGGINFKILSTGATKIKRKKTVFVVRLGLHIAVG